MEFNVTVEEWLGKDNTLGIDIWHKKYQQNNESFNDWINRISGNDNMVAQLIIEKKFLPGGRILSNRGINDSRVTYSNCYVVEPPEDSIESIYDSRKKLARTYSYGGGCGIDISKLAPAGAKVRNQAKVTSGAVSFMDGYSTTTQEIGQNGRRGALMISISCEHPDLIEFIKSKTNLDAITKANISVRITDAFMQAVKDGKIWTMSFVRKETGEEIIKQAPASEIYDLLCRTNWDYAEPGVLYWDRIEKWNLLSNTPEFQFAGVNPCAEEPLPAGGSCLLGSLNLAEFVYPDGKFNYSGLGEATRIATRYLNDVLEEGLSLHPLEEQRKSVADWRQIGLGVFGIADMLIKMGFRYGSEEALRVCDDLGNIMINNAVEESALLASERGVYPKYDKRVVETEFFRRLIGAPVATMVEEHGLRNSQLLTIAPTGSLSTMLGVSGGIEPIFANYYTRKTESLHGEDVYYKVYTPIVAKYIQQHGLKDDTQLPDYFVTASDITPEERIRTQSLWQRHIDASISSTVNLPESATVEDIKEIYMRAWEQGLKGITVYRDGCRRSGILITDKVEKQEQQLLRRGMIIGVDDDLLSTKRTIINGCGKFYLHVDFNETTGEPLETYIDIGSGGGCERNLQFISRLMSVALRSGVPIEAIIDQAKSIRPCVAYVNRSNKHGDTSRGTSCPAAIGFALEDLKSKMDTFYSNVDEVYSEHSETPLLREVVANTMSPDTQVERCQDCNSALRHEGGCNVCINCGWSKCQ